MDGSQIFRKTALERVGKPSTKSDVLQLSPAWTRWTYWVLLSVVVSVACYGWVAQVSEYASGPAILCSGCH